MATQAEFRPQIKFDEFVLDRRTGELWRNGGKVSLAYQSFQILSALLEHPGQLITREDLVKRLWASDVFVDFEGSLNKAIKRLRETLNDSADTPRFIETLPRRGYRFIARFEDVRNASAEPANLIGRRVSHYRVLEVIGGGGMGVVYRGEDLKLGRQVALKFLPEELGSDPQALERFSREARAASSLDHPNICPIYEFGDHEGQPFIVMQFLEGQTLRDRLAGDGGKPLAVADLLSMGTQVCDGLQAAHEKGIIHRDIKPANIFLNSKGVCKILDFGLVRLLDAGGTEEAISRSEAITDTSSLREVPLHLTRTGVALGTAGYMSPEQIRGEPLDARADIFSLGLVLYEMATGQAAFTGDTAAVVHDAILNRPPVRVREVNPDLSPELEGVLHKALEKDRAQRHQSAVELGSELQRLKNSTDQSRRRWPLWLAASLVVVAEEWGSGWVGSVRSHGRCCWSGRLQPILKEIESLAALSRPMASTWLITIRPGFTCAPSIPAKLILSACRRSCVVEFFSCAGSREGESC
jgi:eukaryotic-like serine/threonine-protein kinase